VVPVTNAPCAADRPLERASIVLAAVDCVVGLGHHGLAAGHVAEEAGLDVAVVREHFPSTAMLAEAVLGYVGDQILPTAHDGLPPAERLHTHLTSFAAAIQERPGLFVVLSELEARSRRDALVRPVVRRWEQTWRDVLAKALHDGKASGVWARELDDVAVVDLVIAAAVGVRHRGAAAGRTLAQLEELLPGVGCAALPETARATRL
jgi:AcrR family transcriptional regulator